MLIIENKDKRIVVLLSNVGTSPIPEDVNILVDGNSIKINIDQMGALYVLLRQAIDTYNRIGASNPNAPR